MPATHWGFADRGLIREGFAADLVVFDPGHDRRRRCRRWSTTCPPARGAWCSAARGIAATVVNGEVLLRDGKHTGALPGRLLRGPLAARA